MWELEERNFTDFKGKYLKKCKNILADFSRYGDILVTVTNDGQIRVWNKKKLAWDTKKLEIELKFKIDTGLKEFEDDDSEWTFF